MANSTVNNHGQLEILLQHAQVNIIENINIIIFIDYKELIIN